MSSDSVDKRQRTKYHMLTENKGNWKPVHHMATPVVCVSLLIKLFHVQLPGLLEAFFNLNFSPILLVSNTTSKLKLRKTKKSDVNEYFF